MTKSFLLAISLIFFSAGCGNVLNSNSFDESLYGVEPNGSEDFLAARDILSSQCFACHGTWSAWTSEEFVANGEVVAGSAETSNLFRAIRGNGTIGSENDMPPGPTDLTPGEILVIRTWIESL